MNRIIAYLDRLSRMQVLVLSLVSLALVGVLDYTTGPKVSMTLFYFFPLVMVTWYVGPRAGRRLCVGLALVWAGVGVSHFAQIGSMLVVAWNIVVRLIFFFIIIQLLTALKTALEHERALARTDELTGLLNRRAFYAQLHATMQDSAMPCTLVYMDLDNFKVINDTWGHDIGDGVLMAVAATLRHHLRATDSCARFGGDEFAILLPDTDAQTAARIIQRLHAQFTILQVADISRISCSMGVTTFLTQQSSMNHMLRYVDQAMYKSKHGGKGQIHHIVLDIAGARPVI